MDSVPTCSRCTASSTWRVRSRPGEVRQFLAELPEIRSRRLAFNRGVTLADAFAVATPLLAPDGSLIAAISAAVDASEADRLDAIGEQLKKTVDTLGPKYGLKPR